MKPFLISLGGVLLLVCGIGFGNEFRTYTTPGQQEGQSVLCEQGLGLEGEYAHFRRSTRGLSFEACTAMIDSYRVQFPVHSESFFCSPTSVCPK